MNFPEIKEAVIIGFILAFLIGPVFFMLIETSILKGFRAAMSFDLGVIFGDIIFLFLTYFGSKPLISNLENNPIFLKIGGIMLIVYGIYAFLRNKKVVKISEENIVIKEDAKYLRLFLKGFFINLINIGTLGFWLGLMFVYGTSFQMIPKKLVAFFGLIILTYMSIDMLKVVLAKTLRARMTSDRVYKMKKILGLVIAGFGLILFSKTYIPKEKINQIEKAIEKPMQRFERKNK